MERIARKINLAYYVVYSTTLIATVIGYLLTLNTPTSIDPQSPTGITLSSILIIYILISIPASLALFYRGTKIWKKLEDEKVKLEKYQKGAIWRLVFIGIGLIGSVIIFFFLRTQSIIFCAAISAVALLFCRPNAGKISSELDLDEE